MTTTIRRSVCPHDCPDACALQVHVEDGRVVRVTGDPSHPFTRGFLCVKVTHYAERVNHPDRVLTPLVRVGAKGESRFRRASWDEALDLVAGRFQEIAAREGPEAILPYSYAGTMGLLNFGSLDRRFFHRLGASLLERTICSSAGKVGYRYTMGSGLGTDPEATVHARLILLWGTNTVSTNVHLVPFIKQARSQGARVVFINPHRTRTAALADQVLQPRPGTDAALALGLMHVIIEEGRHDQDFIQAHTVGFEQLRQRACEFPPERVAAITGLRETDVIDLARAYATVRPALIRTSSGIQRHSNGGMTVRTIACLPALVGAWRDLGGGMVNGTGAAFPVRREVLERPDLLPAPRPRSINMIQVGEALLRAKPPIKAMYVYNSNPASVAPDQRKVLAGLRRDDLFLVVHEQMMTETAAYADVVLPATTCVEHTDLYTSYGHLYLQLVEPAIPPIGEAKPNVEVFRLLAARMGFADPCLQDSDEDLIRQALDWEHPFLQGITPERLRKEGWVHLSTPGAPFQPYQDGRFATPSGRIEFYAPRMLEAGLDPLPAYEPPAESRDGSPALYARYPISLITPGAHHFLNSTFGNVETLRQKEDRPVIEIHPVDAAARGIRTGDRVRVFNERGTYYLEARVGPTVPPSVAAHASLWSARYTEQEGNCNLLTSDRAADMGGGSTFHTNLVELARADGGD